jgi:hypothetical protein
MQSRTNCSGLEPPQVANQRSLSLFVFRIEGADLSAQHVAEKGRRRMRAIFRRCRVRIEAAGADEGYELAPFHCPMPPVLATKRIAHLSYGSRRARRRPSLRVGDAKREAQGGQSCEQSVLFQSVLS